MLRIFICAALLATPVQAAQQQSCQALDPDALGPEAYGPSREYANGRVRLVKVDIEEPTCCAVFLEVHFPVPDQEALTCTLLGQQAGNGWGAVDLEAAWSSYDPGAGLEISVPVSAFNGDTFRDETVHITINQALGSVLVE